MDFPNRQMVIIMIIISNMWWDIGSHWIFPGFADGICWVLSQSFRFLEARRELRRIPIRGPAPWVSWWHWREGKDIAMSSDWGRVIEVVGLAWTVYVCVFSCKLDLEVIKWDWDLKVKDDWKNLLSVSGTFQELIEKIQQSSAGLFLDLSCSIRPPLTVQEVCHDINRCTCIEGQAVTEIASGDLFTHWCITINYWLCMIAYLYMFLSLNV